MAKEKNPFYQSIYNKLDESRNSISSDREYLISIIHAFVIICFIVIGYNLYEGLSDYIEGNHPITVQMRVGAICYDGWRSSATGNGACSHHGGVRDWITVPEQIGFHYSQHQQYFTYSSTAFCLLLLPTFFFRYYIWVVVFAFTIIAYLLYFLIASIPYLIFVLIKTIYKRLIKI